MSFGRYLRDPCVERARLREVGSARLAAGLAWFRPKYTDLLPQDFHEHDAHEGLWESVTVLGALRSALRLGLVTSPGTHFRRDLALEWWRARGMQSRVTRPAASDASRGEFGPLEAGPVEFAPLEPERLVRLYEVMVLGRALEERMIRVYNQGDGAVWIGGPGEEALNASLGLLVHKGQGPLFDYLHLHYRSGATLLAMGADPVDSLRQMMSKASDPYSRGRNLCHHYSVRRWNVVPVSSPIEVQFSMAPGTALANKRAGGVGITIVQGGDAGTAEGDFATCMIWCSRPQNELPCLMVIANNGWGISTPAAQQHGEKHLADRAAAFGIRSAVIDGNDAEVAYRELERAMEYVRRERRPFVLEARVSRLYGHSSATGGNRTEGEEDCLSLVEDKLVERSLLTRRTMEELRHRAERELLDAVQRVRGEPMPEGRDGMQHVYAERDLVGDSESPSRSTNPEGGAS